MRARERRHRGVRVRVRRRLGLLARVSRRPLAPRASAAGARIARASRAARNNAGENLYWAGYRGQPPSEEEAFRRAIQTWCVARTARLSRLARLARRLRQPFE